MLTNTKNVVTFENASHTIKLKCERTGIVDKNNKVKWETYFSIDTKDTNMGNMFYITEKALKDLYDLITEYYNPKAQGDKQAK